MHWNIALENPPIKHTSQRAVNPTELYRSENRMAKENSLISATLTKTSLSFSDNSGSSYPSFHSLDTVSLTEFKQAMNHFQKGKSHPGILSWIRKPWSVTVNQLKYIDELFQLWWIPNDDSKQVFRIKAQSVNIHTSYWHQVICMYTHTHTHTASSTHIELQNMLKVSYK